MVLFITGFVLANNTVITLNMLYAVNVCSVILPANPHKLLDTFLSSFTIKLNPSESMKLPHTLFHLKLAY